MYELLLRSLPAPQPGLFPPHSHKIIASIYRETDTVSGGISFGMSTDLWLIAWHLCPLTIAYGTCLQV
jgi:hypothetical protein